MRKALVLLLLVTLALSKSFDSYVVTGEKQVSGNSQSELNAEELLQIFKHNFGSLVEKPSEKVIQFIKNSGLSYASLINPIKKSFVFLIQGQFDKNAQQNIAQTATYQPISLENSGKNHFFDQIFNLENESSLINSVAPLMGKLAKNEFKIFSQGSTFNNYLKNFGITFSQSKNGAYNLEEKQQKKSICKKFISNCMNKALKEENLIFDSQNIVKGDQKIVFNENNKKQFTQFMVEMCGIISLAQQATNLPSFSTFHISSLPQLKAVISSKEYELVQEILSLIVNKAINKINQNTNGSSFGQIIFVESEADNSFLLSNDSQNMKVRLLQQTPTDSASKIYVLRSWFGIFFVAIIFFVLYAMFNIDITRDSLLYAKFIATDSK